MESKRTRKTPGVRVGDVFELATPGGLVYGQYVLEARGTSGWGGSLVRVKLQLLASIPKSVTEILDGTGDDLATFFTLREAAKNGVATRIVTRLPVPQRWGAMPLFRVTGELPAPFVREDGPSTEAWDETGFHKSELDPDAYAALPELVLLTEGALIYEIYKRLDWPVPKETLEAWYEAMWEASAGVVSVRSEEEPSGSGTLLVVAVDQIDDDLQRLTLVDQLRSRLAAAGATYEGSEVCVEDGRLRFFIRGDSKLIKEHVQACMADLSVKRFEIESDER